jgi:hypothetical protein
MIASANANIPAGSPREQTAILSPAPQNHLSYDRNKPLPPIAPSSSRSRASFFQKQYREPRSASFDSRQLSVEKPPSQPVHPPIKASMRRSQSIYRIASAVGTFETKLNKSLGLGSQDGMVSKWVRKKKAKIEREVRDERWEEVAWRQGERFWRASMLDDEWWMKERAEGERAPPVWEFGKFNLAPETAGGLLDANREQERRPFVVCRDEDDVFV